MLVTSDAKSLSFLFAILSFGIFCVEAAAQKPRDNFCRRHAHQTTVIDDKLYIDGGYVDFDTYPVDHRDIPSKCYISP